MNVSREQADKIIVGGGDVSFPDGGPDVSPTGTAVLNGPVYIGKPTASPEYEANLNVASNGVSQSTLDRQPKYQSNLAIKVDGNVSIDGDNKTIQALLVNGDVTINGNTNQDGDITATGTVKAATLIGAHTSGSISGGVGGKSAGAKAFDIPHPSKEGHRLRHICLEGPETAVYHRGRLKESNVINLPDYWKDLVHEDSITVQLQPIGSNQNLVIQEFNNEFIVIAEDLTNTDLITDLSTIDCFYHVYGERKDVERLIVEYQGTNTDDYPGDNSIYSINR
tara:strand:+ start:819 stop:1658 length:840 start_codon:yes stop_codon:yes gene_type:complete